MNNQPSSQMANGKKQYIMFDLQILHPDIWYWENVASCPEKLLDIIQEIDKDPRSHQYIIPWSDWVASDSKDVRYGGNKQDVHPRSKINTGNKLLDQKILYVLNSLDMAIDMCFERYLTGHGKIIDDYVFSTPRLNIKKYNVGHGMGPHWDGSMGGYGPLEYSSVFYFNDDYEGGEIEFPELNIKIKPTPGSMVIFPAKEGFVHQVNQVQKSERYMMTALLNKKQ